MRTENDFPKPVRRTLAERAAQRCSNPTCGIPTSGPHSKAEKSVITGHGAHIHAARPKGKRYDPNMTPEERRSIENGIWLCAKCAKLIDSDENYYTPELLKKWKKAHENSIRKEQAGIKISSTGYIEAVPMVSAVDLVEGGFLKDKVHLILNDQNRALQNSNDRLVKFLKGFVDKRYSSAPITWRAIISGFPILGNDIESPSMIELAGLVMRYPPYISKHMREEYLKRTKNALVGILAEVEAFLEDSMRVGGLPLTVSTAPPPSWRDFIPWLWEHERSWKIDEALIHGRWTYGVLSRYIEKYPDLDIGKTWAGFLFDIISRLPNPDKQKGQILKKLPMFNSIYIWCATTPKDFRPPLTGIPRTIVSTSDHTLAGIYKLWKENTDD